MASATTHSLLVVRCSSASRTDDTKLQVERLKEVFDLMGVEGKAKLCKGMAGLIEEGEDVISEHDGHEEAAADLALIAAAQKVEHYLTGACETLLADDPCEHNHTVRARIDVREQDRTDEGSLAYRHGRRGAVTRRSDVSAAAPTSRYVVARHCLTRHHPPV
jgi:hypothetical protein